MHTIKVPELAFALLLLLFSCSTESPEPEKLLVTVDNSTIKANGFDEVQIKVMTLDNKECTAFCRIFVNDRVINGSVFIPDKKGTFKVRAEKDGAVSDTAIVNATDPGPVVFTKKILCEDYTGAWCGHCPRVGIQLDKYINETNPDCIMVGIHNGDNLEYIYEAQLRNRFGVTGFPCVVVDRDFKWDEENRDLDKQSEKRAVLGLALESTVEGSSIKVKVRVKSEVTTIVPMKLVVMLVEDNIILSQRNYGYWNLPDPITDYSHKNVLRVAATDIFGDDIPVTAIVRDAEWTKDFTISAGAYNISKCKIVAFVVFSQGTDGRTGVINAQEVAAGETAVFD